MVGAGLRAGPRPHPAERRARAPARDAGPPASGALTAATGAGCAARPAPASPRPTPPHPAGGRAARLERILPGAEGLLSVRDGEERLLAGKRLH